MVRNNSYFYSYNKKCNIVFLLINLVLSLEKGKEVHSFQQENPSIHASESNDGTMQTESVQPISKGKFDMNKFIKNMNKKIEIKKNNWLRNEENKKKPIN